MFVVNGTVEVPQLNGVERNLHAARLRGREMLHAGGENPIVVTLAEQTSASGVRLKRCRASWYSNRKERIRTLLY